MLLRIGVLKKEYYCEKRNVTDRVNLHEKRATYHVVKLYDIVACIGLLFEKISHRVFAREHSNRLRDYYKPFFPPPVDLIHTCNVVCQTTLPWIATFEGAFPLGQCENGSDFHHQWMEQNYHQLALPNCKKLLAFSNWAKNSTLDWMLKNHCQEYDIISKKITVLYPPQAIQITKEEIIQKFSSVDHELRFIFVGHDFFRKGMYECLLELVQLKKVMPIRLYLISSLTQNYTYRVPSYDASEVLQVRELIKANVDWIEYHEQLSNQQVLSLCKKAHIGLLPTYRDSFGYSVIEMQSCGCTMLTTDIFALPELNDPEIGFVCHIQNAVRSLSDVPEDAEDIQNLRFLLQTQLHEQLQKIVTDRNLLCRKALLSLQRVAERYDPDHHATILWSLYQDCLENS